jgi:hypothetical protein
VEALPAALRVIHDQPGESGYSPYEILFGRERNCGALPYPTVQESPDAIDFVKSREHIDKVVAHTLNTRRARNAEGFRRRHQVKPTLKVGDRVKVLRPRENRRTEFKVEARWVGPSIIRARTGEHSYVVEMHPGKTQHVHRDKLLLWIDDVLHGDTVPLFFFADPRVCDDDVNEYIVEKITRHRRTPQGGFEFLTFWRGYPDSEASWEPLENFFVRYSVDIMKYLNDHHMNINIAYQLLHSTNDLSSV